MRKVARFRLGNKTRENNYWKAKNVGYGVGRGSRESIYGRDDKKE